MWRTQTASGSLASTETLSGLPSARRSAVQGLSFFLPASLCSEGLPNRSANRYAARVDASTPRKFAGRDAGSLWTSPGTASQEWSLGQRPGSGQGSASLVLDDETKARRFPRACAAVSRRSLQLRALLTRADGPLAGQAANSAAAPPAAEHEHISPVSRAGQGWRSSREP